MSIADQPLIGTHVVQQVAKAAPVDRQLLVRIGDHSAMTGKVFGNGSHTAVAQAARISAGEIGNDIGLLVKRAIADNFADAPVEIDARRETQIDIHGTQFGGDEPAHGPGERNRFVRIFIVMPAELTHRRNLAEFLPKALHAPPFVIDSDQQRWTAQRPNRLHEIGKLRRGFVVAAEEGHATDRRLPQQLSVSRA